MCSSDLGGLEGPPFAADGSTSCCENKAKRTSNEGEPPQKRGIRLSAYLRVVSFSEYMNRRMRLGHRVFELTVHVTRCCSVFIVRY